VAFAAVITGIVLGIELFMASPEKKNICLAKQHPQKKRLIPFTNDSGNTRRIKTRENTVKYSKPNQAAIL
jgi:hypothetical protein